MTTAEDAALVAALRIEAPTTVRPDDLLRLVARCRADLAGSPPGAMPELVARLARQRVSELVPAASGAC